jgi:hypothetical protein
MFPKRWNVHGRCERWNDKGGLFQMKKIILIIMFLLCSAFASAITQSYTEENNSIEAIYTVDSPIVKVIQLKYEPFPVEPGTYFTMWLRLDNIANEDAENVVVEAVDNYPFKIDGNNTQNIGKLGSRQSAVIKFERIRVDENALPGDNEIEFRINMGGGYKKIYFIQKLKVTVQTVEPLLSITVSSQPEKIPQGGIANVSIEVQNLDKSYLKDITLKLVLPSSFTPIGSTAEKKIQNLGAGETSKIDYMIIASSDAEAKPYQIELDTGYSDETGTRYNKNETVGLMVGAEPSITFNLESSDTFESGITGKITVSLSNTGPSQLKFLTIELLPSEDYAILSNAKSYLGNLDPDDFETSEFKIYAKKKGDLPIKLKAIYKDSYNNDRENYGDVNLKVYSSSEIRKYGLSAGGGSNIITWLVYVIIAIFAYLSFVEWRKERDLGRALKNALRRMIKGFINLLGQLRWRNIKRLPRRIKLFLQQ